MPLHRTRPAPLPPARSHERNGARVPFFRSLCFASIAALVGCSHGNGGPAPATVTVVGPSAASVAVATTPIAVARARSCRSNDDCRVDHTDGLCVPKAMTKEQSDAADFLERAMRLQDLVTRLGDTSSSSRIAIILHEVHEDLATYSQMAQGRVPGDAGQGGPLTREQMQQMQDAAWMHSGAAQAQMIIGQLSRSLSSAPITMDAQKVQVDITGDRAGIHLDQVIRDLQTLLHDIEVVAAPINKLVGYREPDGGAPGLRTGAGALAHYLGPVLDELKDAVSRVSALLAPSAIPLLDNDLTMLSQGHDLVGKGGSPGMCLGPR